jgi:hypothetical protein
MSLYSKGIAAFVGSIVMVVIAPFGLDLTSTVSEVIFALVQALIITAGVVFAPRNE